MVTRSDNSSLRGWRRVSKRIRCPICDHPDWCSISVDGALAVCMRDQVGAIRGTANGGYLHCLKDSPAFHPHSIAVPFRAAPSARFAAMTQHCVAALSEKQAQGLADSLGLSADALTRLGAGWSQEHQAYTFPMMIASRGIVGIRLRRPNGSKFAVTGSREGLFIPSDTAVSGMLLITEGPTDCAALLDLGFAAIGRPSCQGAVGLTTDFVKEGDFNGVVIVADADEPGQRGAETLASVLRLYTKTVRTIMPPSGIKDAREWKRSGATRSDVQQVIDQAKHLGLVVRGVLRG